MSDIAPPPRAVEPLIGSSSRCCAPTALPSRRSRRIAFLSAIGLSGPRDPEDIRRAGLATLAPPPERHAAYRRAVRHPFPRRRRRCLAGGRRRGCRSRPGRAARRRTSRSAPTKPNESGSGCDARRSAGRTPLRPGGDERSLAPAGARSRPAPAAAARPPAHARAARRRRRPAPNLARGGAQRRRSHASSRA